MKSFINKILFLGICVLVILVLLIYIVPTHQDSYLSAYKQKCELLKETPSPRIIFIGGSNLAFGLNSQRIKDSLHVNVINYGLHAGIGLKYMIDDITSYGQKGDVLVFAPEYHQFYNTMYGVPMILTEMMANTNCEKLNLLNSVQSLNVLKGIPSYLGGNLSPQIITPRTYLASGFNSYGDEVKHWKLESIPIQKSSKIKEKFNESFGEYFIEKVKKLQTQCDVLIIPPVCRKSAFDVYEPNANEIACFLKKKGCPFIIDPSDCALPDNCAYDSDFHMNKKGVELYTSLIIKTLNPYMKGYCDN